ncbi:L-carnitine CoA-transferase [Salmonella enterica]|uniref:L-carnitine CoA-transferase n=3 Tax=Salmonella enterica TaxID=28901 RepID=A0A3K8YP11_SALER|nr:L-carnitine CoA-transferase [Salmonella enterica]ECJ2485519.1 L-carnitine CoA-transferase [Salmonella enterica subsp. houtenae]EDS0023947.1 L-carnitine CoA-transferase [Salmonella enterica subsp. enterica serovar Carswell]EHG4291795.1 L-carnitine CoA-transferase [Salmonella enterica subsp. houtenae serovar 48:g,z51:-]EHM8755942.1 L-carnitine CoA-transferase [Salmonella enterica subsp. houtenae serovar 44:z36,[z38]:-]HAE7580242.1 L-carnitine CoA-transferase [Salmonella enterica subsp. houten
MTTHLPMPAFGPLSGLRVVFSGIEIAGPFAGQMFAEWGAEVIWIENVAWADTIRVQPNYPQLSRRNLHALSLNIFKDEGREAFLKLMETTDIFIEASKGPAFSRRGITDEVLWEHNPKLVIAHLSGFGQFGDEEYTHLPAYNTIAQAFSGYLIQNGDVDQPMPAFPYTADYFSGLTATTSALAALHKVRETGKGESIDIAMYEVMLRMGQYFMMDYFNGGELCPRMTKGKDPYYAGCGLYKCADGYIVMELVGITQINECFKDIGLAPILGTPEVPEGTQLIHRIECPYGPLVEEKLDAWLATRSIADVQARFAELNIACAKVLTIPELEHHPQYVARESITQWQTMDGRTCKGPNVMPKFKNNPGKIWRAMPSHGMDTAAILKNIGYSEADIKELVGKGLAKVED